jgi:accessory gene regulator B
VEKIAKRLTNVIYKSNSSLTDIELKKIEFGLECFLSEVSKILIYLAVFSMLSLTKYFLLALFSFSILRSTAGGYHDNTYLQCLINSFILMCIIIVCGTRLTLSTYIKSIIILLSIIFIIIYAPVDHYNKHIISKSRRNSLKFISICIFTLLAAVSIFLGGSVGKIILFSIFVESITLPLGYYFNRKEKVKY